MSTRPRPGLLGLLRDVGRSVRGHDLVLYAAGTTAFAAVGLVPLLLLSVRLAALLVGPADLVGQVQVIVQHLPTQLGARDGARWLLEEGAALPVSGVLACLVPASLYGEGVVRALDRLSVQGEKGHRALRGRLGAVALLAASPLLLLAGAAAGRAVDAALGDGAAAAALGVYLGFLVAWLAVSAGLLLTYGVLAPARPGARALLWGAFGTGSVLAGFGFGVLLFLRLGLPVERAYAGSALLGALAVAVLWLLLLQALVLLGYVVTLRLDARDGRPAGPVTGPSGVRSAHPARANDRA